MVVSSNYIAEQRLAASKERSDFRMPNPGDVFMLSAFGWAALCFLMVTVGGRFFNQLARLSSSSAVRELLAGNQSAIAGIMVVGLIGIAVGYFVLVRYPKTLMACILFCMSFGAARWAPIHDPAFIMRYLVIVFLAISGGIYVLLNFWRILATPYYRLVAIYLAWISLVVILNGVELRDVWYLATEFTLMLGLGLAWISRYDSYEKLIELNKLMAYMAIPITVFHMISPLVIDSAFSIGRFQSYSDRATGFATTFSLLVVPLFWLSMYEERKLPKQIATVFALIGISLVILSGTRNATVASILGVGVLWWIFRTRIFVYLIALAILGLLVQILLSGNESIEVVTSRLGSTENTRLGAWALYGQLSMESPIFGYGYAGLPKAVYGATLVDYVSRFVTINVPGVHNYYLGLAVRFGIPAVLLVCLILYLAFSTAWRVVFSRYVPDREKRAYIMPCAMLTVVAAEGLFEDPMGSTGKGSLHGAMFAISAFLMVVYGRRLLEAAQQAEAADEAESRSHKLVTI